MQLLFCAQPLTESSLSVGSVYSIRRPGLTVRILCCVVCAVLLCSQLAHAAEVSSNEEVYRKPPPFLGAVLRNALPPRSAFPMPQVSNRPGKLRLYAGMGAVVLVGVALLGYGLSDSCKLPNTRIQACVGGANPRCGTVAEYGYSNCAAYKAGGAAVTGLGVFGIYAVHKWGH